MKSACISFSTKDKVELSSRTILPILQPDQFDLQWVDGSNTIEGQERPEQYNHNMNVCSGIKGGADLMLVYSLTKMLKGKYDFIGLVESDVLLDPDWFGATMDLFEKGRQAGLEVGAVSPRSYIDRILIQREGWAVMLNQGAGAVILTRKAAELILDNFRTGWWPHTRSLFARISGIDIGHFAAFRGNDQWTSSDWHWDALLASHGLASLALTPAKAEMIGQSPTLAEQGLELTTSDVPARRDPIAFELFAERTRQIREGRLLLASQVQEISPRIGETRIVFAHQAQKFGAKLSGAWRSKWEQGFGGIAFRAGEGGASLTVPAYGTCSFLVSGGASGARCAVRDTVSGYSNARELPPAEHTQGFTNLVVPGAVTYRAIELELDEGGVFYGYSSNEDQPWRPDVKFDYETLPPV